MVQVRWTAQAAEDLESLAEFISRDSPHYARLLVLDVFQAIERLAPFPKSGRVVPELNDPTIREILLGDYRIVYRVSEELIDILTVYHGARILDPGIL